VGKILRSECQTSVSRGGVRKEGLQGWEGGRVNKEGKAILAGLRILMDRVFWGGRGTGRRLNKGWSQVLGIFLRREP